MSADELVQERTEIIVPGPAEGFASLVDVPLPRLDAGEPLPMLWQWMYLVERPATADLRRDGHPVRGAVPAPPDLGRRRMWAGGRVTWHGGLVCGREATRRSRVIASVDKVAGPDR